MSWQDQSGVVELPDGAKVRCRGLRHGMPDGPDPQLGIFLIGKRPPEYPWRTVWVRWPDFWLPRDPEALGEALAEAHSAALAGERVELACGGGRGRTGTALACLAQIAGVSPEDSVRWVRENYHPKAVETPWQRRFAGKFTAR
jgi:hypothetical protein